MSFQVVKIEAPPVNCKYSLLLRKYSFDVAWYDRSIFEAIDFFRSQGFGKFICVVDRTTSKDWINGFQT